MRLLIFGFALVLVGCPRSSTQPDAAVVEASADASVEVIDAGPPLPSTLEPVVTVLQKDGGVSAITANTRLDDAIAVTVVLPTRLKDFRLRLMDWADKIVASDDELQADGVTWVLTPTEPLKSGRSYTLKLDAELGPVITDETGGTWNDWELPFQLAGDVQPEPAAKKPSKKKK